MLKPQTREQTPVPDLYVLTVAFLALKKTGFPKKKKFFPKKKNFFFTFFLCTAVEEVLITQIFIANILVPECSLGLKLSYETYITLF